MHILYICTIITVAQQCFAEFVPLCALCVVDDLAI